MNQSKSTTDSAGDGVASAADGDAALPTGSPRPSLVPRFWVFLSLAVVGGAVDLWSKEAIFRWRGLPAQKDIWWVWEPYFGIETAVNIGAVFGLGAGQGPFFAAMSVIAAIGILIWLFGFRAAESWWLTVALGLVGGGIIGNLYDRLGLWWQPGYPEEWQSGVRDWILWRINARWTWPNFNIADSLLVIGAGMLLYQSLFPGQFFAEPDPEPPEPVSPEPVSPEPVSPEPVSPEPVSPEPVSPEPVSPESSSPPPAVQESAEVRRGGSSSGTVPTPSISTGNQSP